VRRCCFVLFTIKKGVSVPKKGGNSMALDDDDDEFNNVNSGEPRPLLQEGIYPARWVGKDISLSPWGEKLVMHWQVSTTWDIRNLTAIAPLPTPIASYYNAKRDKARRLKFGPLHSYRKDWIAANNGRLPSKPDSLSWSVFRDRWLFVEVVTVKKDQKGCELHPSCYYSKVQRVIRPVGDDEAIQRLPLQYGDITWRRD
jgi:hypothetical protein